MSDEVKTEEQEKIKGLLYANKKQLARTTIHVRQGEHDYWVAKTPEEYGAIEDPDKAGLYTEEKIAFRRPSWTLATWVDELSSYRTDLGMKATDPTRAAENTLKYYLKETSLAELEFEKDAAGHERISDKCWQFLTGEDGLAPSVLSAVYRAYREMTEL